MTAIHMGHQLRENKRSYFPTQQMTIYKRILFMCQSWMLHNYICLFCSFVTDKVTKWRNKEGEGRAARWIGKKFAITIHTCRVLILKLQRFCHSFFIQDISCEKISVPTFLVSKWQRYNVLHGTEQRKCDGLLWQNNKPHYPQTKEIAFLGLEDFHLQRRRRKSKEC